MPKLPRVSAREMVRALVRAGYVEFRQKGSHLHLVREADGRKVTVPVHGGDLPVGLIAEILRQAGLSADDLRQLLA